MGFVVGSEGSVVTFVVDLIVGFVVVSEDSIEGLIVIVEVVEVCDVVKGVFRYGQNTRQNWIFHNNSGRKDQNNIANVKFDKLEGTIFFDFYKDELILV